jgi:trigger factor
VIKDRPTENGDEVVLDYAGFCDGVQFPGGTAENQTLVLGSGMFIPGFEEQLLDKVCEEPVLVEVTFPTEYHAPNLAGKKAEFRCTIHEIRVKTQYELDDTFAQEVGGCYTMEELREQVKKSMQEHIDQRGEMDLQDRLLRQAAATLPYTVDPKELEEAVTQQLQNLEAQLAQQGLNLQMYCQFMQTTEEDLRKDAYPAAEAALKNMAAVDKIVELENLEATQEELGQAIAVICRNNGVTVEDLKDIYDAEFEKAVMRSVLTGKVMAFIREAADVTEV